MDPEGLILSGPATRAEIGIWIIAVGQEMKKDKIRDRDKLSYVQLYLVENTLN
jgi:hypothetical protein